MYSASDMIKGDSFIAKDYTLAGTMSDSHFGFSPFFFGYQAYTDTSLLVGVDTYQLKYNIGSGCVYFFYGSENSSFSGISIPYIYS